MALMNSIRYGIIVDSYPQHGLWLDSGELRHILDNDAQPHLHSHRQHGLEIPFLKTRLRSKHRWLSSRNTKKSKALGLDKQKAFEEGETFRCLHKKDQRVKRRLIQSGPIYPAMIENLDTNIGKLLDLLNQEGIAQDTSHFQLGQERPGFRFYPSNIQTASP